LRRRNYEIIILRQGSQKKGDFLIHNVSSRLFLDWEQLAVDLSILFLASHICLSMPILVLHHHIQISDDQVERAKIFREICADLNIDEGFIPFGVLQEQEVIGIHLVALDLADMVVVILRLLEEEHPTIEWVIIFI